MNSDMTPPKYQVGAIQFHATSKDKMGNINRLTALIRQAADDGAKLVVAPEMAVIGLVWSHREEIAPYVEPIPDGETTQIFVSLAQELDIHIAIGLGEVDPETDVFYNCAILVGPEGYIGKHRKVFHYMSDPVWAGEGEQGFQVFDTALGRLGMMICMDANYMESARLLALNGAQVILFPAGWFEEVCPAPLWITRAFENNVYMICANQWGEVGPSFCSGGSVVLPPHVDRDVEFLPDGDGIIVNEINLSKLEESSYLLETRKPQLYQPIAFNRYLWDTEMMNRMFTHSPFPEGKQFVVTTVCLDGGSGNRSLETLSSLYDSLEESHPRLIVLSGLQASTEEIIGWCQQNRCYVVVESPDDPLDTILLSPDEGVILTYQQAHQISEATDSDLQCDTFSYVDTELGRIGLLAGVDLLYPEALLSLASQGVSLVCVATGHQKTLNNLRIEGDRLIPTQNLDDAHWNLAQVRASENEVYLAVAGSSSHDGIFMGPILFSTDAKVALLQFIESDVYVAKMQVDTRSRIENPIYRKPGLQRRKPALSTLLLKSTKS